MKRCAPDDTQDTLDTRMTSLGCSRQTTPYPIFLFLILAFELLELRPSLGGPLQQTAAAAGFPRCRRWECVSNQKQVSVWSCRAVALFPG